MSVLAIDLGGSHAACAVVSGGRVLSKRSLPSDALSLHDMLPEIGRCLVECCAEAQVPIGECAGIGIGFPAIIDAEAGEILSGFTKYQDVTGQALRTWAHEQFGLPLKLENDARLALLGEHAQGAARGAEDVVLVTLGTGIGVAAMLQGQLLHSRMGQAGQLGGHLTVNMRGRRCLCGAVGCAEAEASTSTLALLCREHAGFATSLLRDEPVLDFRTLFRVSDLGDPVAGEILRYAIEVWSVLSVMLIHAYGPELLLFGGGVMQRGEAILPGVRAYVDEHLWKTTRGTVRIEAASLGETAALLGAETLFARVH